MNLRDSFIRAKLIIFFFIIYKSFTLTKIDKELIILLLIYLTCIFAKGIIKGNYKYGINIIEIVITALLGIKFVPLAIILTAIVLIELFVDKLNLIFITVITISPLIMIKDISNSSEIICLVCILLMHFNITYKQSKSIYKLEEADDTRRNEVYKLQEKLKEEQDFKEQLLYTIKLEERNIISNKLHDKIGHTISGTLLQLEAIKLVIDTDIINAKRLLDLSINNLRTGMDDIRMTLRDIRPVQEELGINRIKLILEQKTQDSIFKFKVKYNGDLDKVCTAIWMLFVQAVKELSTNTIKYSKGSNIYVEINVLKEIIKFEFKDDGVGCINFEKGIGLSSLEEKILSNDGKLIISSESGFSVIILIPYK